MSATAQARVSRGARLLDERIPGWAVRIDTTILDMSSTSRCVLGQLGDYNRVLFEIGLDPIADADDVGYGFDTTQIAGLARRTALDRLAECWQDEIAKRRVT